MHLTLIISTNSINTAESSSGDHPVKFVYVTVTRVGTEVDILR